MKNVVRTEDAAPYRVGPADETKTEKDSGKELRLKLAVDKAIRLLSEHLAEQDIHKDVETFSCPANVKDYLVLTLAQEEREHFHVLFLNNQHRLVKDERLFSGTIDAASVYPREIVKSALYCNAAAVILAHNHPSGGVEPSAADKKITSMIKDALNTVDIKVLDHIVVGSMSTLSFAEYGLI